MNSRRIVHSCTSESFSGLERYVLDLALEQYRTGLNVELFCREGTELFESAHERGLPIWSLNSKTKKGPAAWAEIRREWHRRLSAGDMVLHMHAGGEPWFHLPWLLTRPNTLKKTILQYHIWINHSKKDPLHWAVFRGIDEVWCSSETARVHLSSLLPVPRDHFRVVFYGRDVARLSDPSQITWRREIRERFSIPENEILGVCVSRIEPIKGIAELFDAFVNYASRHKTGTLLLVGDTSPNDESAERLGSELKSRHTRLPENIRSRLLMPGYLGEIEKVLAASDFYVVPAYEECNSLSMIDSAVMGKAILGTNSGGTPSVVRPGETGELVPPKDAAAMERGLEKLFLDSDLRTRCGLGAKALAPTFDRRRILRNTAGLRTIGST